MLVIGGLMRDQETQAIPLLDPRAVVPKSIMPSYPWLATHPADRHGSIQARMRTLAKLGHPYSAGDIEAAPAAEADVAAPAPAPGRPVVPGATPELRGGH